MNIRINSICHKNCILFIFFLEGRRTFGFNFWRFYISPIQSSSAGNKLARVREKGAGGSFSLVVATFGQIEKLSLIFTNEDKDISLPSVYPWLGQVSLTDYEMDRTTQTSTTTKTAQQNCSYILIILSDYFTICSYGVGRSDFSSSFSMRGLSCGGLSFVLSLYFSLRPAPLPMISSQLFRWSRGVLSWHFVLFLCSL